MSALWLWMPVGTFGLCNGLDAWSARFKNMNTTSWTKAGS
jgi:hypothetical protein